jgi:acyl-coenzyme A synthetase/AMP-(fatty) acid ligase
MGVNEDDLTVSVPKLFFGYATGTNLLFPFAVGGATALFSERSTAEKMFEVIKRYRPTILTTVPTMINSMLNVPGASPDDLASLRFCYSAGEALPIELYERWMNAYGVDICDGIGSAEMFHIYITNRPGDIKPGSLGRIVPGYEAKIVDAESNEVPTGDMGTLKIKGDSAALCYWKNRKRPLPATGARPAISFTSMLTVITGITDARTTCSRSPACSSRPQRSRTVCYSIRRFSSAPSSATNQTMDW